MNAAARYLATLSFLSRLAPARVLPEDDLRRAMFHLPLAGLIIGAVAAAPAALGLMAGKPFLQAWLAVALLAWVTRGLHLDGLSDVADAAAAHVEPEHFWTIVKDSRCGAFGVVALILALGAQGLVFAEMLRFGDWWAVIWAVVFGRACAVVFGRTARAYVRPGLGGLFLAGASTPAALWAVGVALAPALWLRPLAAAFAAAAALVLLLPLRRLVTAVGGVNGDFLGAAITLGEISAGLGYVLAQAS